MKWIRVHSGPVALLIFLVVYSAAVVWTVRAQHSVDFAVYYLAARALHTGTNIYTVPEAQWLAFAQQYRIAETTFPYLYPPLTAGVVNLFAALPYAMALLIWNTLSVMALLISGLALSRLTRQRWLDPAVFIALAFYVPNLTSLYAGQVNAFVLLGIVLYLFFAQRQRICAAGVALATSIMLKPLAVPLLVHLLWRRDFRKLARVITGLMVAALLGLALAGLAASINYLENAGRLSTLSPAGGPVTYPPNQSLCGFWGRLFTQHEYGAALVNSPALAQWSWLGTTASLLLGVAYLTWPRRKNTPSTFALETGLVLVTINLIVPTSWYHHAAIALIPIVLSWCATRSNRLRGLLIAAFVLINVQGMLWHSFEGSTLLLSLGTYGLLIIYAATAYLLLQVKRQACAETA